MRVLGASVLAAESLLIFFAILVAANLGDDGVDPGTAWAVGGVLALTCLLLSGLLRYRWAYMAGSVVQVALIAAGFVVPAMFFLGVTFAGIWAAALYYGHRVDVLKAQRAAAAGS